MNCVAGVLKSGIVFKGKDQFHIQIFPLCRCCGLVGQSACLVNRRSWVQIPAAPFTSSHDTFTATLESLPNTFLHQVLCCVFECEYPLQFGHYRISDLPTSGILMAGCLTSPWPEGMRAKNKAPVLKLPPAGSTYI